MRPSLAALALVIALATPSPGAAGQKAGPKGEIPITTAAPEARALYVEARAASEALRPNEARALLVRALEKDPSFALAHLLLAQNAGSAKGFFDAVARAKEHLAGVTEAERRMILLADAGVRGDVPAQTEHATWLARTFPRDARAQVLLGNLHFGRQEYDAAASLYEKAVAIAPRHALAWNQLGYARRFLRQYPAAEKAFERYVAVVPDEPNARDSQAELLMEMGRFEDSIAAYETALAIDARFVPSYVGIANDQVLLGRGADARATLGKLRGVARSDGELRQAEFWTAVTWLHEGKTEEALSAMRDEYAIAERAGDAANMAQDLVTMGQIRLHAGRHAEALADFAKAVEVAGAGAVPEEVKENVRRNHLFFEAWTAVARGDLASARARAAAYREQAEAKRIPFELRRIHELDGQLALARGDFGAAAAALAKANPQDPYVLTLLARAQEGSGDHASAGATWARVASWNQLSFPWAFVRAEARKRAPTAG